MEPLLASDAEALRRIRVADPAISERWSEDEEPSTWEGVTIEYGRVIHLDLSLASGGKLSVVGPAIGQLDALSTLGVCECERLQLAVPA